MISSFVAPSFIALWARDVAPCTDPCSASMVSVMSNFFLGQRSFREGQLLQVLVGLNYLGIMLLVNFQRICRHDITAEEDSRSPYLTISILPESTGDEKSPSNFTLNPVFSGEDQRTRLWCGGRAFRLPSFWGGASNPRRPTPIGPKLRSRLRRGYLL